MSQDSKFDSFDKFATTIGMMLIILTVVYSNDKYDIWDLAVGCGLSFSIFKFRKLLSLNYLILSRIGFGLAIGVIIASIIAMLQFWGSLNVLPDVNALQRGFWDYDIIFPIIGYVISLIFIRPSKASKK